MQSIVCMYRGRLVDPEAVEFELDRERDRATDEHAANHGFAVARSPSGGDVVDVSVLGPRVTGFAAFVPVVGIALVAVCVVHPFRAFGVVCIVVVNDVGDDGDASPMALADQPFELVATTTRVLDGEVV